MDILYKRLRLGEIKRDFTLFMVFIITTTLMRNIKQF